MARRFSDLEDEITKILKNGGDPSANSDERIKKYWSWKLHKNDAVQRKRDVAGNRNTQGVRKVLLHPFATDSTGTNGLFKARMSKRAYDSEVVKDAASKPTFFGWKTAVAKTVSASSEGDEFKAARAIIRQRSATIMPETSKITGKEYKTYAGSNQQGFIYPFGRTATGTEAEAQLAIAQGLGSNFTVRFQPEKYKESDNVEGYAAS